MTKKWKAEGTIKSKLLPIEIATNDYWEASDDDNDPAVVNGEKRYFTWDEAMAIKADGWRLPTRTEWMRLCIEFGEIHGDIDPDILTEALGLGKNGYIYSGPLRNAGYEGDYWTSTAGPSTSVAYYLYFDTGGVNPSNYGYRSLGFSARLVRDVKE